MFLPVQQSEGQIDGKGSSLELQALPEEAVTWLEPPSKEASTVTAQATVRVCSSKEQIEMCICSTQMFIILNIENLWAICLFTSGHNDKKVNAVSNGNYRRHEQRGFFVLNTN